MIATGILNPAINSLLSRVRHTNTFIISDSGFPSYQGVETIDISLVTGIPRVVDVLDAVLANFSCTRGVMAAEFRQVSSAEVLNRYERLLTKVKIAWVPHAELKVRVRSVLGIIRTGDATRFGNILLESS